MTLNFDLSEPYVDEEEELGFNSTTSEEVGGSVDFDLTTPYEDEYESNTLDFDLSTPYEDEYTQDNSWESSYETSSYESPVQLTKLGEDYSISNLSKHDGIAQLTESILEDRLGEEGKRQEGETNRELMERYMTHMRYATTNTVDIMQEVDYVKDLSKRKKEQYAIMYGIYDQMPNFATEGGGGATSGTLDVLGANISDPVFLASLALSIPSGSAATVAALAARKSGKALLSKAVMGHMLKGNIGRITAATTLEGLGGAMAEAQRQELKIEIGQMEEKDWGSVALVGGVSAGASLLGLGLGAGLTLGKKSAGISTNAETIAGKLAAATDSTAAASAKATAKARTLGVDIDPITGIPLAKFDVPAAERIRNSLSMPDAEMSPQVNRDITAASIAVAENLMELLPEKYFRLTLKNGKLETPSSLTQRLISNTDHIDDDILEQALSRTGLAPEEFAQVTRLAGHEGGATLQLYQAMSERLKKMAGNNPVLKAKLDAIYGKPNETRGAVATVMGFLKRLDRESRALMVVQIATTARNVISAGASVTFGAAAKMVEGTLAHTYSAVANTITGKTGAIGFKQGMAETWQESIGAFSAIMGHKESMELAKLMLKDNSRLSHTLFRSLQETGNETLTKTTRMLNGLNMMQDQVVRSGVFTDSVNRQMKQLDLNMYDYISNNKPIPTQVLKKATDDALESTFALMPEKGTVLRTFVDAAESIPFVTTSVFPFARFMADAMAFQYKYSPLNFFNAAAAFTKGGVIKKQARGLGARAEEVLQESLASTDKAAAGALKRSSEKMSKEAIDLANVGSRQTQEAMERVSKGVVGSGLLYSAILYRNDNQEKSWFHVGGSESDKPVDIRAVFPMAPYLAVADLIVKWNNGDLAGTEPASQLLEGIAGTQLRPTNVMDSISDLIVTLSEVAEGGGTSGDEVTREKLGKIMGNWAGSIMGRPLTAAQILRDTYAAFDDNEAIVRETRMVDGEGMGGVFAHTFMNHIKSKVPIWQQELPEYRSPTTGGTVRRQSAVMNQLTGIKYMPKQNEMEKELEMLGMPTYKLTPHTGNKQADYIAKKHMPDYANIIIGYQMASPLYKSLSKRDKRTVLNNRFGEIRKMAIEMAKGEAMLDAFREGKSYSVFDEGKWAKTPEEARVLANEYFQNYYGHSVAEMGAYAAGAKIGVALEKGM